MERMYKRPSWRMISVIWDFSASLFSWQTINSVRKNWGYCSNLRISTVFIRLNYPSVRFSPVYLSSVTLYFQLCSLPHGQQLVMRSLLTKILIIGQCRRSNMFCLMISKPNASAFFLTKGGTNWRLLRTIIIFRFWWKPLPYLQALTRRNQIYVNNITEVIGLWIV